MQTAILNKPIKETVPHIFKRPLLSVNPSDSLMQVGAFLALGPQIYVDGLVVLDQNQKIAGTIGGRHVIEYILSHHKSDWSAAPALAIMTTFDSTVEADRPLTAALDMFATTEFAFVPITIDHKVVTSLSLRDLLKIAAALELDKPIRELSSSLIEIDDDTSMGNALEIMLEGGIRSLVVQKAGDNMNAKTAAGIINDRQILEFLISHEGRQILTSEGLNRLFEIKVNTLALQEARVVNPDISAGTAAAFFDVSVPCLLLDQENSIVTPWDIVMKGMRG
jgi:predicted transcriptional regulator